MFAVDEIGETLEKLRHRGAQLVGEGATLTTSGRRSAAHWKRAGPPSRSAQNQSELAEVMTFKCPLGIGRFF